MAIGGVIISVRPEDRKDTEILLGRIAGLTVYSCDEQGNIIARICRTDTDMVRDMIKEINEFEVVRSIRLAYLIQDEDDVTGR